MWDRLWRERHDAGRDSAQILRERRSPRWRLVLETLTRTFGEIAGLRTVELGSGRGDLSALLALRGAQVTLVDHSEQALARARERFDRLKLKGRFVPGNMIGDLADLAGRFDCACSLGVIEHFKGPDRGRAVRAHRQMLRDGGLAIISVPHALGIPYRLWKAYLEIRGWWPYGFEMPYSRDELRRLAAGAGFEHVVLHASGFWQSIGDHWGRGILRLSPDWVDRPSRVDPVFGATLTMLAWAEDRLSG
jgi:SAM-dependent methyltransferase